MTDRKSRTFHQNASNGAANGARLRRGAFDLAVGLTHQLFESEQNCTAADLRRFHARSYQRP